MVVCSTRGLRLRASRVSATLSEGDHHPLSAMIRSRPACAEVLRLTSSSPSSVWRTSKHSIVRPASIGLILQSQSRNISSAVCHDTHASARRRSNRADVLNKASSSTWMQDSQHNLPSLQPTFCRRFTNSVGAVPPFRSVMSQISSQHRESFTIVYHRGFTDSATKDDVQADATAENAPKRKRGRPRKKKEENPSEPTAEGSSAKTVAKSKEQKPKKSQTAKKTAAEKKAEVAAGENITAKVKPAVVAEVDEGRTDTVPVAQPASENVMQTAQSVIAKVELACKDTELYEEHANIFPIARQDASKPIKPRVGRAVVKRDNAPDIIFETGKLALLADGAVVARAGGTVVMVTAVSNRNEMDASGFLPLSVEYRQKAHALGMIPRTRDRREGQPSDAEVLTARAIDRVLRPLFPAGYCFDTQIIVNVQALEEGGDPVSLAINAASAALCVSNIPWNGPAACVRVGRKNGEIVLDSSPDDYEPTGHVDGGGLDVLYACHWNRVLMIEMGGGPVGEAAMKSILRSAQSHAAPILEQQLKLIRKVGKLKITPQVDAKPTNAMMKAALGYKKQKDDQLFSQPPGGRKGAPSKADRGQMEAKLLQSIRQRLSASPEFAQEHPTRISAAAEAVVKHRLRDMVVLSGIRPDGRKATDVRPLAAEVDLLPSVHGSGVFTRGETQTLSTVSLGPPLDASPQRYLGQAKKNPEEMLSNRMYLHYEFPPYCTNEIGKTGGTNRRMIGHGNLAEKAILPVMPHTTEFPYTTRVTAEVTMSNGSSSMATACATSLALMDAGVPISAAVGGISVGLMTVTTGTKSEYAILTDLQGSEDHYGDMDFKVAGTHNGITAMQLDVKLPGGVPTDILEEALSAARLGRLQVLDHMKSGIRRANNELKPHAPRCEIVRFEPDRKKDLIGVRGETLLAIEEKFGVQIDTSADGRATVYGHNAEGVKDAVNIVRELVQDIQEGEIYNGKITTVYEYGCLVELLSNQQGLLHVSNMTDISPAPPARDVVKEGQEVQVRVIEVDRLRGLIKLNLAESKLTPRNSSDDEDSDDSDSLQANQ